LKPSDDKSPANNDSVEMIDSRTGTEAETGRETDRGIDGIGRSRGVTKETDTETDRRRDPVERGATTLHRIGNEETQMTDGTGEGQKSHKMEKAIAAPEGDHQRQIRPIDRTSRGNRDGFPARRSTLVETTREVGVIPHPRVKW